MFNSEDDRATRPPQTWGEKFFWGIVGLAAGLVIAILLGAAIAKISPTLSFSKQFISKWATSGSALGFVIAFVSEELLFTSLCLILGMFLPLFFWLGDGFNFTDLLPDVSGGEVNSNHKRNKRLIIAGIIGLFIGIGLIIYFHKH